MQVIAIAVTIGLCAAALGWWVPVTRRFQRWLAAAGEGRTVRYKAVPRACWPLATGAAGVLVATALLQQDNRPFSTAASMPWALAWSVAWAGGLVLLGLVDLERLVLPSHLVHLCGIATCCLLLASGSTATGEWHHLGRGALCAAIALIVFGSWALLRARGLGLGDARMAGLVAFGAGTFSPAGCFVALSCAPLMAAAASILMVNAQKVGGRRPTALGPFLAIGGIAVVVASAF
jgi:leader peptidase (prepilin peptidase) / N-methyltransferase